MTYPRNAASPEPIAIGAVVQISDGAVQTSGCTVRIKPIGVAEGDGGGTTAYSTDGVVLYTPTQAETNYTSFVLIAKKTGCIPVAVTVVTSASATAGYVGTDQGKIANATSTVNLSGTTIKAVTDAVTLPASANIAITGNITGNLSGSVGSVTGNVGGNVVGSVGSISGVTFPSNFASLGINASGHVSRVTLTDTVTTLTNDPTGVGTLLTRLSDSRAGYLDNLNIGGLVAGSSEVTGLNVNTRSTLLVPIEIETPDSSTQTYKIRLHLYDETGNMEAPDSTPTVTLTNAAGTDRSSRLSVASNPSTGVYVWDYTATAGDAEEQLVWLFTVTEGSVSRTYPATSYVVEQSAYRFSSSDRATLNAILADSNELQTDWADGGRLDLLVDGIKAKTDNLPADPADASDVAAAFATVNSTLATLTTYVDTEVAAIKTVTDKLGFTGSGPHYLQVDVVDWKGTAAPAMTGDAYAVVSDATNGNAAIKTAVNSAGTSATTAATKATLAADLLEADGYIKTSTTPWQRVLIKKGTGTISTGTQLLAQNLKDEAGVNVTDIATFIGQSVSP